MERENKRSKLAIRFLIPTVCLFMAMFVISCAHQTTDISAEEEAATNEPTLVDANTGREPETAPVTPEFIQKADEAAMKDKAGETASSNKEAPQAALSATPEKASQPVTITMESLDKATESAPSMATNEMPEPAPKTIVVKPEPAAKTIAVNPEPAPKKFVAKPEPAPQKMVAKSEPATQAPATKLEPRTTQLSSHDSKTAITPQPAASKPIEAQAKPAPMPPVATSHPAAVEPQTKAASMPPMATAPNAAMAPSANPMPKVEKSPVTTASSSLSDLEDDDTMSGEAPPMPKDLPRTAKLASMEVGEFLMQNLFIMFTAASVVGLLLFVVVRRGKKTREPIDF